MKKKLIATLIAGAVLSTGIIGLTACGGGHDINKGEEVDEAGWKAAITATCEAKNLTAEAYEEYNTTLTGSMGEITDLNVTGKTAAEGKYYYDVDNGNIYVKETVKTTVSGVPDELKDEEEFKAADYVTERYAVKDGDKYYSAVYRGYEETPEWQVNESSTAITGSMAYLFNSTYATEEGGATTTISELYASFTYSGGVYTATLWSSGREMAVSLSVKGGYVVGISKEYTQEEGDENSKMTNVVKSVYNFSNYGSTTVKASDEAKKAVEDYKAE